MGLARSWLRLHATPKLSSDLPELLTELSHEQATTLFEMLSDAPDEAARSFAEPPFPSRAQLGKVASDDKGSPRFLATHEPSESAGRLYLPSFRLYLPYMAPRTYVQERQYDAPADAYSMTPAKAPSAVPLRDYLPSLVVALLTGEEFAYAPRPDTLPRLGISEVAAELAEPTVRFTDLRLAREVKPIQLSRKLPTYLHTLGGPLSDAEQVRSWKRRLLEDEDSLEDLGRDFGEQGAGVIAISFAAAAILLMRDLAGAAGLPVAPRASDLHHRISSLASVLQETLEDFEGYLRLSSQKVRDWSGLEKRPEEDGRRIHYGQKLLALWAYRMGVPRREISRQLGIRVHYESGRESPHWRGQLWQGRFAGGIEAERSLYPEFAELFDVYERDHELQLVALKAYHLHLSAILEERPRFYVRLLSVPRTNLPSDADVKKRIFAILEESGIAQKEAKKIVNNAPTMVAGGAHEEEKAERLKAALERAGAEAELERLLPPTAPDIDELLRDDATETELLAEVRRLKTGLERLAHDAFAKPAMDEWVYLLVADPERDHLEFAELDKARNAERANLKHDVVEEHTSYWRRLAGELGLDHGSELERRSARAYVQLGSCMVRGLPVYPEPPESLRRSTQGESQSP